MSVKVKWDDKKFRKSTVGRALDGIEECARTKMVPRAKEDCPVESGTLRGTIGIERNDRRRVVYFGCGGAAKDYAAVQELDRTLNHPVGKAGFIRDSVDMNIVALRAAVQARVGGPRKFMQAFSVQENIR